MKKLEEKLGYEFHDKSLLQHALTHSSYSNERHLPTEACNERLEFLGDSILGMITAEYLFRNEPTMPEGKMTRLRAELVCERSLVVTADELGLGEYLLLSHGETVTGGRERPSIKADAVEAVLAAVYIDGGFESVKRIIYKFILSRRENVEADSHDYKTELQEVLQRTGPQKITYALVDSYGPDHDKHFSAAVYLNGEEIGRGDGRSKKRAEQDAAKNALSKL